MEAVFLVQRTKIVLMISQGIVNKDIFASRIGFLTNPEHHIFSTKPNPLFMDEPDRNMVRNTKQAAVKTKTFLKRRDSGTEHKRLHCAVQQTLYPSVQLDIELHT